MSDSPPASDYRSDPDALAAWERLSQLASEREPGVDPTAKGLARGLAVASLLCALLWAVLLAGGAGLGDPRIDYVIITTMACIAAVVWVRAPHARPTQPAAAVRQFYTAAIGQKAARMRELVVTADLDGREREVPHIEGFETRAGDRHVFAREHGLLDYWRAILFPSGQHRHAMMIETPNTHELADDLRLVDVRLSFPNATSTWLGLGLLASLVLAATNVYSTIQWRNMGPEMSDAMVRSAIMSCGFLATTIALLITLIVRGRRAPHIQVQRLVVRVGSQWKLWSADWGRDDSRIADLLVARLTDRSPPTAETTD